MLLTRTLRMAAVAALILSGVVLAARAIIGPFRVGPVPVTSPMNAQSVFGLAVTLLLMLNSRAGKPAAATKLSRSVAVLIGILLLTLVVLWRALGFPLVFDEYTLARYGQDLNGAAVKYYFTKPGGDGFFRPIGYVSLGLDAMWADHDPFRWHLFGLGLHLINVVLVWMVARRFLQEGAAALWAAALFAVHGTVLFTPTYLAARFDALCAFFVLAGLVLWLWYLREGRRFALALSFLCVFLGLLTKEIAFSFPFLATLVSSPQLRKHWRPLAGYFLVTGTVFAYRFRLLGGIGGYQDSAGTPNVLHANFVGYLKGFALRIWSVFYFPVNWSHRAEPWLVIAMLAAMTVLAWSAMRVPGPRAQMVRSLAFTGLALLPIAHLLLIDARLFGAWRFYLPLAGFAMFLGLVVQGASKPQGVVLGAALVLFQIGALRHNMAIWAQTAALVEKTCASAAMLAAGASGMISVSGLPAEVDGVPFLSNGFESCVAFYRQPGAHGTASRSDYRWDAESRQIVPK